MTMHPFDQALQLQPQVATVVPVEDCPPRVILSGSEWTQRYDLRAVRGMIPQVWDDAEKDSLTQLRLRDQPPRALDHVAGDQQPDRLYKE